MGAKVGSSHRQRSASGGNAWISIFAIMDRLVKDTKRMDNVACPSCCAAECDAEQVFEAIKGEVEVVNKDDEVVVEPSGGAAGVDVVVGRHVLLVADDVHVGMVEHVLAPVNVAGLSLATQGAGSVWTCGREWRFRGDPRVRLLGNVRVKLACW